MRRSSFGRENIHPDNECAPQIKLRKDAMEAMASYAGMEDRVCPACGSEKASIFIESPLQYKLCSGCETVYLSPFPSEEAINDFHARTYHLFFDTMGEEMKKNRKKFLYDERADFVLMARDKFLDRNRVNILDVGGGDGTFAESVLEKNVASKCVVLDRQTHSRKLASNIEIVTIPFEQFNTESKFDIITFFEVLEHIKNPDSFLGKLHELLQEDGICVMSTPNSLGYEIQTLKGDSHLCFFDHVSIYNTNSLKALLEKNGFELLYMETNGCLDVEDIIKDSTKELDCLMQFMNEKHPEMLRDFQGYLQDNKKSSTMRCVFRKKRECGRQEIA